MWYPGGFFSDAPNKSQYGILTSFIPAIHGRRLPVGE